MLPRYFHRSFCLLFSGFIVAGCDGGDRSPGDGDNQDQGAVQLSLGWQLEVAPPDKFESPTTQVGLSLRQFEPDGLSGTELAAIDMGIQDGSCRVLEDARMAGFKETFPDLVTMLECSSIGDITDFIRVERKDHRSLIATRMFDNPSGEEEFQKPELNLGRADVDAGAKIKIVSRIFPQWIESKTDGNRFSLALQISGAAADQVFGNTYSGCEKLDPLEWLGEGEEVPSVARLCRLDGDVADQVAAIESTEDGTTFLDYRIHTLDGEHVGETRVLGRMAIPSDSFVFLDLAGDVD